MKHRNGIRLNITQPTDWVDAFTSAAAADGVSLSEWIGQACLAALPASTRRTLSERPGRGRPRKDANNQ